MITYKATFGRVPLGKRQEAEDALESYVSALLRNGQACGEYFHVLQGGKLCAYVILAGIHALSPKYCDKYDTDALKAVIAVFGHAPRWTIEDDEAPPRDVTWARAPFLYLFTHMFDWDSPLCRGDNGKPIPIYRLPSGRELREAIYGWQRAYRHHDAIFINSGKLEVPAYRELACPKSELSEEGRKACRDIERATGRPTYYFLTRYWGRREEENSRRCPGCGRSWRTTAPIAHPEGFWQFAFQCSRCRLVSHVASVNDEPRRARIGEWVGTKRPC